jgi:transcription elongation factor GreA
MITPNSLVELVRSGDFSALELAWNDLMESDESTPGLLVPYKDVLTELRTLDRQTKAEEFAWSAIEVLQGRLSAEEVVEVARAYMVAAGEGDELRAQGVKLYRACYGERDGFEALLTEAGLGGGRPIRRAVRTMDVCINLSVGDYLCGRDGEGAAQVVKVDTGAWEITVKGAGGKQTFDAVRLADTYRKTGETEFAVLRQFSPELLDEQLKKDPARVVIEICREHGDSIDALTLERFLVPDVIAEADWKKWWTKARTALKRCRNIKMEGRTPCVITYADTPVELHEELWDSFSRLRDPEKQLEAVEMYFRECKASAESPSVATLNRCYDQFAAVAERSGKQKKDVAALHWAMALRVRRATGNQEIPENAIELLKIAEDLGDLFRRIQGDELLEVACDWLIESRPDDWVEQALSLLPSFPLNVCETTSVRLVKEGCTQEQFEPLVQEILSDPLKNFEAILWLWDGPSEARHIPAPPLKSMISRILRMLDDCRRNELAPKETVKRLLMRSRAILSARKYERFDKCLDELDAEVASALRTQLKRMDNLGRAVREDMISRLDRRFPPVSTSANLQPWEREDVLYVTEEGMAKKQQEIEHHVNVKMKENAQAIGRAAEHGDLSENSEYKFALEERDLLRARLAQMNSEMAMSRVMNPDDVPSNHIGIGSRAVFKRVSDGARYEINIVGPWEADGERSFFNYRAPLCQRVLGTSPGETVEFEHSGAQGEYELIELGSVFAQETAAGTE